MKYIFRGYELLEFDPDYPRDLKVGQENGVVNIDRCAFLPEDYKLLARFFEQCYKYTQHDAAIELEDIEVN